MIASWWQRVEGILPKGRVARSIVTLASGTAAAQAITVCVMPAVTRLYTPSEIGVISLFLAFFNFCAPSLSLRYEYALLNAQNDAESHVINRLAMICVVGTSIISMLILAILWNANILGFGLLPWWSPIAVMIILFGYGQFMVCRSWGLRAGLVSRITKATMARSAANAITRIGFGALGAGVSGLFAAELAGAWGPAAALYRSVHSHFAPSRPIPITQEMLKATMKRYLKFPILEMPSTLVNQFAATLPVPMIATLYGPSAAGWFGLARAMVGIPNTQIGAAVGDVFQVELARAIAEQDHARGRRLFYMMMGRLSLFGLLPMAGVVTLAPWLMATVFGQAWSEAGWIAATISPWLYVALIVSSLSRLLSVLQVQEFKLFYDVAAVLLFVGAFLLARYMKWTLLPMVACMSGAGVFAYLIYLIVLVMVVESRLRKGRGGHQDLR
ncbi:lipopolysaccharide biosynthesis protein [Rhodanobacter glycinis]|uniref:Membrane protein involved in the export of O-antigen and teichoic acid n=1 Tax=Rhodanobacter glycinis TaxID=582702 RepID=A0A1I3ZZZ1_9GAMM|nr:oligosaccharide flippase family protein [Rhodanobacter glycinis]SFK49704.1 Membrane protein involved in the export of O-antigen and teichoic acid [Rhodanobacter glycinis]